MNRPIYEDDLTTIDARHAGPLVRLRHLAAISVRNLMIAVTEETVQAAVMLLDDIGTTVGDMFPNEEIADQDLPFGQVRINFEGLNIGHSGENNSVYSEGGSDDDASWSAEESDQEADSLPPLSLMELARSSVASLTNLRHLYALYYAIHIFRMDRLMLRLDTPSNNTVPSRPESIRQTPPPSFAAGISYGSHYESPQQTQTQNNYSHGGAGVPLTEEKEAQYAQILADELQQVAEYKEAFVRILFEELTGDVGAA